MHVLSGLVSSGTIPFMVGSLVRLVRIYLSYRVKCMEIELQRQQLGPRPDSQPAQAATARHAVRRRKRS